MNQNTSTLVTATKECNLTVVGVLTVIIPATDATSNQIQH